MKKVIFTNFLFFVLFSAGLFAQPGLSSPADKAAGISIEPTLSWTTVGGATSYWLQISTDKSFATVTYETGLSATSWTPDAAAQRLENNKQYYWHVQAFTDSWSSYSAASTFYTIAEVKPILAFPVKNVLLYTRSANLAWYTNPYSAGVKFDLYYSTSAPVDNKLVSATLVSDLDQAYYSLDPLQGGKTYYWQVRSKSAGGTVISYSTIESFSTTADPGPIVPTPSWPVGGATVYTSKPDLFWYLGSADPGLQFKVYYSNASFTNTTDAGVKFIDWSSDAYASIPEDLQPGDYYWRVQSRLASDNTKESSLSAEAHFKVYSGLAQTAPVPVPSWPVGNANVYSTSVQFCWYINNYVPGLYYRIQYKKLTDVGYTTGSWTTDSYVSLDGLAAGETYQWQVQSSLDGTDGKASGWSTAEAKFKIDGGIVPTAIVPTPAWPVKGTTVYSRTPYFSWYVGGDGTGLQYLVEYADDKDFTVNKVALAPTTDLFISGSENALAAGKQYYWHVMSSLDGSNWSTPSAAADFKVVADAAVKPLKPIASSPWSGSQITSTSADLQWYLPGSAAGLKYLVEVYYSSFSPDNLFTSVNDLTEMTTTVTGLTPGATYVWIVYSYEDGDLSNISEHSTIASFTVSPGISSSIVPLTGSPVKGVKIKTDSPVLSWFVPSSSTALKYELQYSLKKDMSDAQSITGIESNFKTLSGLSAGSKYYWRVRSFNAEGKPSAFSGVESFVAASVTGVENNNPVIPAKFDVAQNYPNPFNPSTTIKVSLPMASFLSVKIYNMLGQEVRTLINQQTQAGIHSVTWHGEDYSGSILPSGAYIYRVTAGHNVTTGKMMFLK